MPKNHEYKKPTRLIERLQTTSDLNVIIVSLTPTIDTTVKSVLKDMGCDIHPITYRAKSLDVIADAALKIQADAIIINMKVIRLEVYELCSQLRHEKQLDMPIILIGDLRIVSERTESLRRGAFLCLNVKLGYEEIQARIRREIENYRYLRSLKEKYAAETNRLQAQLATKTEFVQTLSHDLKNPLSIIYGSASLIQQQGVVTDAVSQEAIANILSAAKDMRKLISNLLNLEKMEGGLELVYERTYFLYFLMSCIESFQAVAANKNIELRMETLSADREVELDHDRMIHALSNLISNAIKYTPFGGKITVTGKVDGITAIVTVADTGIGISEDDLPHIFKRFYRAATSARQHSGTGLGLAITKAIIEKHNGTIDVQSVVDKGTTFTVNLPLVQQK